MNVSLLSLVDFEALPLMGLIATVAAFQFGTWLNRLGGGKTIISPVLIAMTILVGALVALDIDYATYLREGGGLVAALLGPATVALAVPLYNNARHVRRAMMPLVCAVLAGGIAAAGSAFAIAWLLGAPDVVLRTILVKSVTAPIAIGVADEIGGIGSLAAALAVLTGVTGTILATWLLGNAGIRSWEAQGLAAGVTAHGQGTLQVAPSDAVGLFSLCPFLPARRRDECTVSALALRPACRDGCLCP